MMRSWLFLQISKQEYARCNGRSGRHWKRRNGTLDNEVNARDHHPGQQRLPRWYPSRSPAIPVGHAAVGIHISHRSLRLVCSSETFICRERSKMRALAVISAGVAAGTPLLTLHYQPGTAE
jgi:hypothetical protein